MNTMKTAFSQNTAELRPLQDSILAERVGMLYANLVVSQTVAALNGALLAALLATAVDRSRLIIWAMSLAAITLTRIQLGLRFARVRPAAAHIGPWLRYFYAGALTSGIVWGSAAWLLHTPDSLVHQVLIAFVLGGMVAGATPLLAPVFPVFGLFAVCALLPAIMRYLWTGGPIHDAMAAMGVIFLLAMLATGKRIHDTIVQSLTLRFENRELVADLTNARQRLQSANADLLATQQTLQAANEELERRVAERTAALETADRRKNEFLAMLSHELRNPLAAICNSSYVLNRPDVGEAHLDLARRVIERQARHLSRLVDDLLDVTRITHGKITLRRERIDLADCIRRCAEDHAARFESAGIRFRVDLPMTPVWAMADVTRIAQLIGNLLQNAAKFTPAGGQVALALRVSGDYAEAEVTDTGAGIDPDTLPSLFEPFVQGDGSEAPAEGGLGLGLALVKGLAELHGGTVRGQSDGAGQGTRFTVRLPLASDGTRRDESGSLVPVAAASRRVLVVDDNRDAADSLVLLVETLGHSAQVAYDGPSAVEKARSDPPDVVLCDLGLPGMNGYEVARALRAEHRKMMLVAVTGYTRSADAARATVAGFDGYVIKPPQLETLRTWLS